MSIYAAEMATIAASLIAAAIALIGLIISKENKTSEFRQQWIDSLRSEISDLISHVNSIHGAIIANYKNKPTDDALWVMVAPYYAGINRVTALIRLRLKPGEGLSDEILNKIEELARALSPDQNSPDWKELNEIEKALVVAGQAALKAEWERVKKGEPTFRVAKWGALIVAGAAATAAIWLVVQPTLSG